MSEEPTEEGESAEMLAIRVEKLLCEKLGRPWAPFGISVVSLIEQLATRTRPTVPSYRSCHGMEFEGRFGLVMYFDTKESRKEFFDWLVKA